MTEVPVPEAMRRSGYVAERVLGLRKPGWRATEAQLRTLGGRGAEPVKVYGMPIRPLPPHVVEAVREAASELLVPPPSAGLVELREAIAAKLFAENERVVDPETELLITGGAMQAVNVVCRTLLDPGDEVLIPAPSFFFYGMVELAGGTPVYVSMDERAEWEWDPDRIEAAITERTKLLLLCSPVNPTGHVVSTDAIRRIFELACEHDFLVLADESYDRMVFDGLPYVSAASFHEFADQLVLVRSLTKSYAMAAWRVGYVAARPEVMQQFLKVFEWEALYGPTISQHAAAAAVAGPQDWVQDIADEFQRRRDAVWPRVAAVRGLSCVKPRATPYMFVNASGLGISGDEFAEALTMQFGVPATGGSHFAAPTHVRIGFGVRDDESEELLCARVAEAAAAVAKA